MAQAERGVFTLSLASLFVLKLHALVAVGQSSSILVGGSVLESWRCFAWQWGWWCVWMKSWDWLAIRPSLNGPDRVAPWLIVLGRESSGRPVLSLWAAEGFEAFQDLAEWFPLSEWTLAETEKCQRTKHEEECDYRIGPFFSFPGSKLCRQTQLKGIADAFEKWIQSQLNEQGGTFTHKKTGETVTGFSVNVSWPQPVLIFR